jgi:hypothetical protein
MEEERQSDIRTHVLPNQDVWCNPSFSSMTTFLSHFIVIVKIPLSGFLDPEEFAMNRRSREREVSS